MRNNNKKPIPASQYYACPSESEGIPGKGKINQAFTLVELIVVITILAILGTIAFLSFQLYTVNARDTSRAVDLGNINKSLEFYSINTGVYPKPDNFSTISYSGDIIWYQGLIGEQVTLNLKGLIKKPLDPLMEEPYIYSVTNNFKSYELLMLYEGDKVVSFFSEANALSGLIPYISGKYNGIIASTSRYIIPIPSIITSEYGDVTLDGFNIKSQVTTSGINIPKNKLFQAIKSALDINLSVFSGSIKKDSSYVDKLILFEKIKKTYSGSTIENNINISTLLRETSTGNIVSVIDTILFNNK